MITPRILIAGAGISGLSLARALTARGITAEVAERGRPAGSTATRGSVYSGVTRRPASSMGSRTWGPLFQNRPRRRTVWIGASPG